jgi:hypothetical protein
LSTSERAVVDNFAHKIAVCYISLRKSNCLSVIRDIFTQP